MMPAIPPAATSAAQIETTWWNAADGFVVCGEGVAEERARDHNPDQRDADEPSDASDGVVDRGRDTGVALVGVGEHRRDERGDGEGEPQREQEQRGKKLGDIGRVHPHPEQEQNAGRGDQRPSSHEETRPERSASAPNRRERANIMSVTGNVVSPLSSALYPATCWRKMTRKKKRIPRPA